MDAVNYIVPEFTFINALAAIAIAFAFILIMSFVGEPQRQKINAIIIAGAVRCFQRTKTLLLHF